MKAHEFIFEDQQKEVLLSTKEINILHADCNDFLQNSGVPLYRGVKRKRQKNGLSTVPIRTDRRPSDLKSYATAAFNYIFESKTGIPYIRNITAFATNNIVVAQGYGVPAMVFPMDGTKYLKSDSITDVFNVLNNDELDEIEYRYVSSLDGQDARNEFWDTWWAVLKLFDARAGQVRKAEIDKMVGKHLPFWKQYIAAVAKHLDTYVVYDSYNNELAHSMQEIAMFGVKHYYTFGLDLITMRNQNPKFNLYMGGEIVEATPFSLNDLIYAAIKNKQEIYATPRTKS